MKQLGVLLLIIIILVVAGVGSANGLCRFRFEVSAIFNDSGRLNIAKRDQEASLVFGAYDKDGAGWTVRGNFSRGLFGFAAGLLLVRDKRCMYPCLLTVQRDQEASTSDAAVAIRKLKLNVQETLTSEQFDSDEESLEINQCNKTTGGSIANANGQCDLSFRIEYLTWQAWGRPLPAILGAYDKDGVGWTVPKNLSRDARLGRDGFHVSNKMCIYPCRLTFQRDKVKADESFLLSTISIHHVSETFFFTKFRAIPTDNPLEIKNCNKTLPN